MSQQGVCKELTLNGSLSNGIDTVSLCWPVDRGPWLPLNARELQAPEESPHTSGNVRSEVQRQLSNTPQKRYVPSHIWRITSDMQSSVQQ